MRTRKRIWIGAFVCSLILALVLPALAEDSSGQRIQGQSYFVSSSSYSAELAGNTYVGSYWGTPDSIEVTLGMYRGGTYLGEHTWSLVDASFVAGDLSKTDGGTGTWEGYGWHYAYWGSDNFTDTCTTYPTASGLSAAGLTNEQLNSFASADDSLKAGTIISYYQTSEMLTQALGHEKGVALDVVIHHDLNQYLRIGDTMPGVVLSPTGDKASVVFFHGGGTITRVDLAYDSGAWSVMEVKELKNGSKH